MYIIGNHFITTVYKSHIFYGSCNCFNKNNLPCTEIFRKTIFEILHPTAYVSLISCNNSIV